MLSLQSGSADCTLVIIVGNGFNDAVCILVHTNVLEIGMNPSLLPLPPPCYG